MKSHYLTKHSARALSVLALCALGAASHLHAQSLSITSVISETVGETAILDAPPAGLNSSGTEANTTALNIGTAGVFGMTGGLYMKVSTTAFTTLVAGRDSLMVARTVNSQTLKDNGTLSVYVRNPVSTAPGAATSTARWSLDLNFSFFSDASLTTPAPTNLLLTSLDIDYAQRYYTKDSSFSSNVTYFGVNGTDLIPATPVGGYTGYTTAANADAVFNDAEHAVSSAGIGSSYDIRLSHDGVALFMFEFRNPPSNIPEPSSALLIMGSLSAFGLMRRRQQVA